MDEVKAEYAALKKRLQQAEAILEALKRGELDMLIGPEQPLVVRFKYLEEQRERHRKMLDTVRSVNRILVKAKEPADLLGRAAVCLVSSGLIHFAWMGLTGREGKLRWSVFKKGAGFAGRLEPADSSFLPACSARALAVSKGLFGSREAEICRDCGLRHQFGDDLSFVRRFEHRSRVFGLMVVTASRGLINDPDIQRLLDETSEDIGAGLFRLELERRLRRDRKSTARLVAALDQAQEGIVVFTSTGRIQYANSAFAAILKQPVSALDRLELNGRREKGEHEPLLELIRQVITRGREWAGRISLESSEATVRHLGGTISPVKERGETPESFVGIFNDVTELVTMERQVQQSQKMESIGRLAGGIAHDFNNMLSVIGGYAELGMLKLNPGHPLLKDLAEIKNASERSAALTRQLLAFSRQQTAAPRVVNLNQLLAESQKMLRRLIREEIELELELAPELWPVYIDPSQVDQIVMNLVVNARDAIEGNGVIRIATANVVLDRMYCRFHPGLEPGRFVTLEVSDTGCGMTADVRRQVFEPFFTTKAKGVGTGLGLSTVYGIVKQNRGAIYVYSEQGKGSTFKIYLPRFKGEQPVEETPADQEDLRGKETILVVEDEAQVRNMAATALKNYGYNVLEAPTVEAAMDLAENHPGFIDLLITDVIMPSMDGKQLQNRIARLRPGMETLFMSGYASDTIIRKGVLEKGIHFIQKPFAITELARKVRQILDTAK